MSLRWQSVCESVVEWRPALSRVIARSTPFLSGLLYPRLQAKEAGGANALSVDTSACLARRVPRRRRLTCPLSACVELLSIFLSQPDAELAVACAEEFESTGGMLHLVKSIAVLGSSLPLSTPAVRWPRRCVASLRLWPACCVAALPPVAV